MMTTDFHVDSGEAPPVRHATESGKGESLSSEKKPRRKTSVKAERRAEPFHRQLDDPRTERTALGAAEQRFVALQWPGAQRDIALDRPAHLRQQRHDAGLVAFAGDAERRAERHDLRRPHPEQT